MEQNMTPLAGTASSPRLSVWEWLPVLALVAAVPCYFLTEPGSPANRFALFVGLGLIPGTLRRLAGHSSWRWHRIGFAAGLVGFLLNNPALRPDAPTLEKIVAQWRLVALGVLLSLTQPLWGALRTHRLLVDSGLQLSLYDSLKLILVGSFFNMFLPGSTGGDAYRIYAITGGDRSRLGPAAASITIDRLLGLPSLILVVLAGMTLDYEFFLAKPRLAALYPFFLAMAVVCLAFTAYLLFAGKSARRNDESTRAAPTAPQSFDRLRRLHRMISSNVRRPATLPLALFHGFMSHLASIASCQCFGLALGVVGVPALRYYLLVPLAMAINAIPGAPGGIGQGELAMAALLDMAAPGSANAQAGVVIMLLFRLSNILIGLVGGIYYALGKSRFSERGFDPAAGDGA